MTLALTVFAVVGLSAISPAEAFASTSSSKVLPAAFTEPTSTTLLVSRSNEGNEKETKREGGEESEEEFQRRMAVVRSLQMSFYGKDASKEDSSQSSTEKESRDSSKVTSSSDRTPEFNTSEGKISNLPLFRAAWYELPGRSNVLIIRDPIYTNMFERMFYTNNNIDGAIGSKSTDVSQDHKMTPWVFGHLYTPKEKDKKKKRKISAKKRLQARKLSTWNETNRNVMGSALSSPSVLGTLMYVRDYRRLKDGRILALVQAAEKFVVDEIQQSLPYAIADVKILPDVEELRLEESLDAEVSSREPAEDYNEAASFVYSCDEIDEDEQYLVNCLRADEGSSAGPARTRAIFESIHSYHQYECDPQQRLDGIPNKSDLGIIDITHDAISKALPYCRFSNSTETLTESNSAKTDETTFASQQSATPSASLEFQLLRRGITKIPPADRRFSYNTEPTYSSVDEGDGAVESSRAWTTDELEYELWLMLDDFSKATNKRLSPILLSLLPSDDRMPKAWPSDFRLKDMIQQHQRKNPQSGSSSSHSNSYPNQRRQRRFSYSAAHLLESVLPISEGSSTNPQEGIYSDNFRNGGRRCAPESDKNTGAFEVDEIQELRALLLSIPSTRQRMRVVLETFHRWRLYQECDEFA